MAYGNSNAPAGEKNKINSISVNNVVVVPKNKTVNISVPKKMSELENDENYKTTDTNTTYSLEKRGNQIVLVGSDKKESSVTDSNDNTNTTYTLTKKGSEIILVGSDKSESKVADANDNTEYDVATEEKDGLMPAEMVKKLNGIPDGGVACFAGAITTGTTAKTITTGSKPKLAMFFPSNTDYIGDVVLTDTGQLYLSNATFTSTGITIEAQEAMTAAATYKYAILC